MQRRTVVLLAAVAVALPGVGSATATAAVGSDSFLPPVPPLRFSEPGLVESTQTFTTQGASEPAAGGPTCPAMSRTAWWVITGTGEEIQLRTTGSDFDTVLAVYDHGGGFPLAGNRRACDDNGGVGQLSALSFAFVRGRQYLVQAGGASGSELGRLEVHALSLVRPLNDDLAAAEALETGVPETVSNAGASQEPAEALTCDRAGANLAATMWFRWSAPAIGDAVFTSSAAFGDVVVSVYRGDGAPVGCAAGSTAALPVRVAPGDYLVQVGTKGSDVEGLGVGPITTSVAFKLDPDLDNDGEFASTDCNDANPGIRHGIVDTLDDGIDQDCDGVDAVNLDRDRDGFARPGDCRDDRPDISPGRFDVPGDAIDQDCKDGPAPFTRLAAGISGFFSVFPSHSKVTALSVRNAPAGGRITMTCTPRGKKGCPRKRLRLTLKKARARVNLRGSLRKAKLRPGVRLRITVTQPGFLGAVTTWRIRARKLPARTDRCLTPGAKKTRRCPR